RWGEQPEHAAEAVVARHAVRQVDDLAKCRRIGLAKIGNIDGTLRPAQRRRQRDEQHRAHEMPRIHVARIANFAKNRDDCFHPKLAPNMRASSESTFSYRAIKLRSEEHTSELQSR